RCEASAPRAQLQSRGQSTHRRAQGPFSRSRPSTRGSAAALRNRARRRGSARFARETGAGFRLRQSPLALARASTAGASATGGERRPRSSRRAGLREVRELDRRADALAKSVLAPLDVAQRDRLIAAMGEIERLIRACAVQITAEAPDSADARWCVGQ